MKRQIKLHILHCIATDEVTHAQIHLQLAMQLQLLPSSREFPFAESYLLRS